MAEQSKQTYNNSKGMNRPRSVVKWWKSHNHAEPTAMVGDGSTTKYSKKQSSAAVNLMHAKDRYVSVGDKGHGGGGEVVRHMRSEYGAAGESALRTDGGWTRPSLTGWKLPPDQPLQ